jgi:oligopeptide/dipeptide ABC transporter ATP-binding protein
MLAPRSSSLAPLLQLTDVKKYYPLSGGRAVKAVNGVSLAVGEKEIVGVVGESGCGKSTLGRLALRLIGLSAGQVTYKGQDITRCGHRELAGIRRSMQMVFQNPFASFNPKKRIGDALQEVCRHFGMAWGEADKRIAGIFADIGLSQDLLRRWPRELSGGQLQRLAIARALLPNPSLIVADEPLSALDVSVQAQLLNLLQELRQTHATAMLFISHDMSVIEYLCDRVAVMYLGQIMEEAETAELFSHTKHPYTLSLKAAAPRLDASPEESATVIIRGEAPNPQAEISGCPFAPRCPRAFNNCRAEEAPLTEISPGHLVRCHLYRG